MTKLTPMRAIHSGPARTAATRPPRFQTKDGCRRFPRSHFQQVPRHKSYLAWSGLGAPARVFYVVFLEPPSRGSAPLLNVFRECLRNEFKNAQATPWGAKIQYEVVDLARFQTLFPNYPVTRLSGSGSPACPSPRAVLNFFQTSSGFPIIGGEGVSPSTSPGNLILLSRNLLKHVLLS